MHGFRSFDERDLLGFVDGTENPEGAAALAAVVIGDEDPEFAGGSYVVVQKYLHDLDAWDALPVEEQERAIGRTKLSDIELPDDVKPSQLARRAQHDRRRRRRGAARSCASTCRSAGSARGEFGTYFIGYARSPDVIEQMLTNMFIGKPPGNHDRILDFSTAVTGNLFFVPTADFLDDPPTPAPCAGALARKPSEDGSLGIGSLR